MDSKTSSSSSVSNLFNIHNAMAAHGSPRGGADGVKTVLISTEPAHYTHSHTCSAQEHSAFLKRK